MTEKKRTEETGRNKEELSGFAPTEKKSAKYEAWEFHKEGV